VNFGANSRQQYDSVMIKFPADELLKHSYEARWAFGLVNVAETKSTSFLDWKLDCDDDERGLEVYDVRFRRATENIHSEAKKALQGWDMEEVLRKARVGGDGGNKLMVSDKVEFRVDKFGARNVYERYKTCHITLAWTRFEKDHRLNFWLLPLASKKAGASGEAGSEAEAESSGVAAPAAGSAAEDSEQAACAFLGKFEASFWKPKWDSPGWLRSAPEKPSETLNPEWRIPLVSKHADWKPLCGPGPEQPSKCEIYVEPVRNFRTITMDLARSPATARVPTSQEFTSQPTAFLAPRSNK